MDTTVYHYIAERNPHGAKAVIEGFGYRVVDRNQMGNNLQKLVATEGEEALKEVLELHPDKDVILEVFSEKSDSNDLETILEKFVNANGSEKSEVKSEAKAVTDNFSLLFLAGVTILAVAILKK